jgi:GT2 family glycosyltransferase
MSRKSAGVEALVSLPSSLGHVCIVVLNWNGWRDTIECLESLFLQNYPSFTVVVCDNASSDGSMEQIRRWANGDLIVAPANARLGYLTMPPAIKPVRYVSYSSPSASLSGPDSDSPLVLIQTGENLGFAGGCNVGLRYALERTGCDFAWLLNNDTVVEKDALLKLVEMMGTDSGLGMCGSVLLDYAQPETVQAFGGWRYSAWRGRVLPDSRLAFSEVQVPSRPIDYVHGASMLVRREFIESVGLMDEGYFLFFEELDWAKRAGDTFRPGYAALSFVYHKEGASIGTSSRRQDRSVLAERYAARSRILFTRKFYPAFVPTVLGWVMLTAIDRLLRGDPGKARQIAAAAWEGLSCSKVRKGGAAPMGKGS